MTSPAHVVPSSTPLSALKDCLSAWHHTGVPVVDDGALVGIISASDLEGVRADDLRHPVSSRMKRDVVVVGPDKPLENALETMVHADIGRLPVLRDRAVIGIITRSDVRRALYGAQ
jgi:tRNA nucleotidyltransferase (CCA-adding enzyme)